MIIHARVFPCIQYVDVSMHYMYSHVSFEWARMLMAKVNYFLIVMHGGIAIYLLFKKKWRRILWRSNSMPNKMHLPVILS